MSCTDLTSIKAADKDLAQAATLSSILYPITWLIIIYTTEVGGELPLISLFGLLLIGLAIATRFVLGIGFDRIYERLSWRCWQRAFGATIILNAGTWGGAECDTDLVLLPRLAGLSDLLLYSRVCIWRHDRNAYAPAFSQGLCRTYARAQLGDIDIGLTINRLGVAEVLEALVAVVGASSTGSNTTERQLFLHDMHDDVVDAGTARGGSGR